MTNHSNIPVKSLATDPNVLNTSTTDQTPTQSTPNTSSVTNNQNIFNITLPIKNLVRTVEYKYIIEGLGGNWPVAILPISGSFIAKSKTADINISAIFCPNETVCPNNNSDILPHTKRYSIGVEDQFLFTTLMAKVSELNSNTDFIYSDQQTINCKNCLPDLEPKLSLPTSLDLNKDTGNTLFITALGTGIPSNIRYAYSFNVMDSSWPVQIYPATGTIKGKDDAVSVTTQIVFCENSGDAQILCGSPREPMAIVNLTLTSPLDNSTIVSNDVFITCNDCLYNPKIIFSRESSQVKSGTLQTISANISDVIPNRTYIYSVESINSNWPVSLDHVSGVWIPKTSKDNKINFLAEMCESISQCPNEDNVLSYNINGSSNAYALLKFKLLDTISNISYYSDTISLSCTDCLLSTSPSVMLESSEDTVVAGSQPKITATLSGLIPSREYRYEIEDINSNWPLILDSISGIVKSDEADEKINLKFLSEICSSKSYCENQPGVIGGEIDSNSFSRISLRMKLIDDIANKIYFSDKLTMICEDCLLSNSGIAITLPSDINLDQDTANHISFKTSINGLDPSTSYVYKYHTSNKTWPAYIYPASGIIINSPVSDIEITSNIVFCENVDMIDADLDDTFIIASTSIPNNTSERLCGVSRKKMVNLSMSLEPLESYKFIPNNINKIYSNTVSIMCDDCILLPKLSLSANGTDVDNDIKISANITDLAKDRIYTYQIENIDSNWPILINHVSGILPNNNGISDLELSGKWCKSKRVCPSGTNGVLDYKVDNGLLDYKDRASFRLKINDTLLSGVYYSNTVTMDCVNCRSTSAPIIISTEITDA